MGSYGFGVLRSMVSLIGALYLVSGCGKGEAVAIDTGFASFVKAFNADASSRNRSIPEVSVSFADLVAEGFDKDVLGVCFMPNRVVKISDNNWKLISVERQEVLIYHELGHCALNQKHRDEETTIDGFTIPKSIMHSINYSNWTFVWPTHKKEFINELFNFQVERMVAANAFQDVHGTDISVIVD